MLITVERLRAANACDEHVAIFEREYPHGVEPTVEALFEAASAGLNVAWTWHLLPAEGPGSRRAYALWCAEQVAHLSSDPRVSACLDVVRRRVADPASVSDAEMADAAYAAASAASAASAAYAAYDASAAYAAYDAAYAAYAAASAASAACAAYAASASASASASAASAAAYAASGDAQIACLSQLLMEAT